MDWYLEVRIRAGDKQYSTCLLIQETKIMKILNILTSVCHVERDTCRVHGRNIKTQYFGLILILRLNRINILSDSIECNYSSRNTSSLFVFQKLWDWRLEKSCMRNHTCLLPKISLRYDHDWTRRKDELGSTVEQQPVGKLVQQSFGEVQHATFSQLTPTRNQTNLWSIRETWGHASVFVVESETSFPWDRWKKFSRKTLFQIDQSNLRSRLLWLKLVICLKIPVLSKLTMDQGNLMSLTTQTTHTGKNNMLMTNIVKLRQSTRTTSSIVKSTRKTSTSTFQDYHILPWNYREPPDTTCSSTRPTSKSIIESLNQEWKQMVHEIGNIELCELLDVEPRAQCTMCLSHWDVGIVHCTCGHYFSRNRVEQSAPWISSIPNYYMKKGRPLEHRHGKKPWDHEYYCIANTLKEKCKKKNFLGVHDLFIRDEKFRNMFDIDRTKNVSWNGQIGDEDHTHHITPEEIRVYRNNWSIRSNTLGSDTMPV